MRAKKTIAAVAGGVLIAGAAILISGTAHASPSSSGAGRAALQRGSGQIAEAWNAELVKLEKAISTQPTTVHPTRGYALLATAMYDAVVSTTRSADNPYEFTVVAARNARPDAAAEQAAHDVLVSLFPTSAPEIDQLLTTQLAQIPAGAGKDAGVTAGSRTATIALALRAHDSSDSPVTPFVSSKQPGVYQLTPKNFAAAQFTNWSSVTPWVLQAGDQFRPPAPPSLSTKEWADAINQVASLGQDKSKTRTKDETAIAKFWAPPIWNTWNEIADAQITQHDSNLEVATHALADLNLSLADSVIAFYDAKYHYQLWRPVTAIRAGTPGNSAVDPANPNWLPQAGKTAADPSYPAAHSTVSEAAATVLAAFFGNNTAFTTASDSSSGVTRSFASFQAAAVEAGMSRIFAGQHTSIDVNAGDTLGKAVAQDVLGQLFGR